MGTHESNVPVDFFALPNFATSNSACESVDGDAGFLSDGDFPSSDDENDDEDFFDAVDRGPRVVRVSVGESMKGPSARLTSSTLMNQSTYGKSAATVGSSLFHSTTSGPGLGDSVLTEDGPNSSAESGLTLQMRLHLQRVDVVFGDGKIDTAVRDDFDYEEPRHGTDTLRDGMQTADDRVKRELRLSCEDWVLTAGPVHVGGKQKDSMTIARSNVAVSVANLSLCEVTRDRADSTNGHSDGQLELISFCAQPNSRNVIAPPHCRISIKPSTSDDQRQNRGLSAANHGQDTLGVVLVQLEPCVISANLATLLYWEPILKMSMPRDSSNPQSSVEFQVCLVPTSSS